MRGIDVSKYQNGEHPGKFNDYAWDALPFCDFVICKASEGATEVDPLFAIHHDYCKSIGKLMGAYHYANGGDPIAEARHFYKTIYTRRSNILPCLDWESGRNASWGDSSWCLKFANEFHRLSGTYPLIYFSASAIKQVSNCYGKCNIWVAGYPDARKSWVVPPFPYSISPWKNYAIWQYTSGGNTLDRDTTNLTRDEWLKLCCKTDWVDSASAEELTDVVVSAFVDAAKELNNAR